MTKIMLFGTFDIIHAGHIHLFQSARRYGDELIVVVARDINVKKIKGSLPFHSEYERKKILARIDLVDKVILGDKNNVCAAVHKYKPDIIMLGYDQKNFVDYLREEIKRCAWDIKVTRAKPYKPERYKTKRIKKHLSQIV